MSIDRRLNIDMSREMDLDRRDYPETGFIEEDIPELIRMATDERLLGSETGEPEMWVPVHARRHWDN